MKLSRDTTETQSLEINIRLNKKQGVRLVLFYGNT